MSARIALAAVLLSSLARDRHPWRHWEPGSEQRPPVYLGLSPRELEAAEPPRGAILPSRLRAEGEAQVAKAVAALPPGPVELEAWPVPDDASEPAWQLSRWRPPGGSWQWLSGGPVYRSWVEAERRAVFDDAEKLPGLYDKPVFGDCVWTSEDGTRSAGGWLPTSQREGFEKKAVRERLACRLLGQPARVDGEARAFVVGVERSSGAASVRWPAEIKWRDEPRVTMATTSAATDLVFPGGFAEDYEADVLALDGEREGRFPFGRVERFSRKNASERGNQLEAVADFLAERYRALGLTVRRQPFVWGGRKQSNVIAVIPGSSARGAPVLLVAHYDTAFAEDVFRSTGRRVCAPGADDDATGTAALLRAAAVLARKKPRHDIWLVHLTGQEFPADGLGARKMLGRVLKAHRDFTGVIVLDMLGHRQPGDGVFQVAAGLAPGSAAVAGALLSLSSATVEPGLTAVLREPGDERSYLYNTDGQLFSDAGYPTVLLNEHYNRLENRGSARHRSDDVAAGIDFGYASSLAKLAIAAAWELAR